jgi:hypothetical protein
MRGQPPCRQCAHCLVGEDGTRGSCQATLPECATRPVDLDLWPLVIENVDACGTQCLHFREMSA